MITTPAEISKPFNEFTAKEVVDLMKQKNFNKHNIGKVLIDHEIGGFDFDSLTQAVLAKDEPKINRAHM